MTLPGLRVLWKGHDKHRTEQLARLKALQLQHCENHGATVREQALLLWRQLPDTARVDLPSEHVFAALLGLFRTCAMLKDSPIGRLELSAEEIAELVTYSKSTVEAALRWLSCETIDYRGIQVARGLGIIHRGRRTGAAMVDGALKWVYRTSRIVITFLGRTLLGLPTEDEPTPKRVPRRYAEWQARKKRELEANLRLRPPDKPPDYEVGRQQLKAILDTL